MTDGTTDGRTDMGTYRAAIAAKKEGMNSEIVMANSMMTDIWVWDSFDKTDKWMMDYYDMDVRWLQDYCTVWKVFEILIDKFKKASLLKSKDWDIVEIWLGDG